MSLLNLNESTNGRHELTTLVELLRFNASDRPDQSAMVFLVDGETEEMQLTFAELDRKARAVAAVLQRHQAAGERAILIYEPGLDYVIALFGCLYASVGAVPAYPLDPLRVNRTLPRLQAIVRDAQATFALTTQSILSWAEPLLAQTSQFRSVIATDGVIDDEGHGWQDPGVGPETLAIFQYTSGSTGSPKGVMLSHSNLMHNLEQLHQLDIEGTQGVNWLPPYHDMGLIGGILFPVHRGGPCAMMSPLSFVQRPIRWLQAISRYKATTSGGPNFGYELCVKKISHEECEGLDLSSWSLAFNGAEPIRMDTLDRFYEKFSAYGLRREAFYPCYGLAEATLIVSGGRRRVAPIVRSFRASALKENRVEPVKQDAGDARQLVSSGQCIADQKIMIVDPATKIECPADRVGEIWVAGPSIGRGYWNRPEETRHTFQAYEETSGDGPFLRTGDLGFLRNGELFVTGRLKDLIIIAGRNHYPQDLERTAEKSHEALKPDGGAAFAVEINGEERAVIVHEVVRIKKYDLDSIVEEIRFAIVEEHDINPYAVVLIRGASLPKTTSGKVQRRACRDQFLRGELQVVAEWRADMVTQQQAACRPRLETPDELRMAELWAGVLGVEQVGPEDNFFDIGGHSMQAVQLLAEIEEQWGEKLPLKSLLYYPTVRQLVGALERPTQRNGSSALVPIHSSGSNVPLFCVHPIGGAPYCYLPFATLLGPDQPIYALQARGVDGEAEPHTTVEEMADHYIESLKTAQPRGPYRLAGWSFGGAVAFEMARRLKEHGDDVELLAVIDTVMMPPDEPFDEDDVLATVAEMVAGDDALSLTQLRELDHEEQLDYFRHRAEQAQLVTRWSEESRIQTVFEVFQKNLQAMFQYRPRPYDGPVTLFRATKHITPVFQDPYLGWQHWTTGNVDVHNVPCEHLEMLREPFVEQLGTILKPLLEGNRQAAKMASDVPLGR